MLIQSIIKYLYPCQSSAHWPPLYTGELTCWKAKSSKLWHFLSFDKINNISVFYRKANEHRKKNTDTCFSPSKFERYSRSLLTNSWPLLWKLQASLSLAEFFLKQRKLLLILLNIDFCTEMLVQTWRNRFSFPRWSAVPSQYCKGLDSCLVCGTFMTSNILEQNLIMQTPHCAQQFWHSANVPASSTL